MGIRREKGGRGWGEWLRGEEAEMKRVDGPEFLFIWDRGWILRLRCRFRGNGVCCYIVILSLPQR